MTLAQVIEAQPYHPVWPRFVIDHAEDGGFVVNGQTVAAERVLQLLEGRQKAIQLEQDDPFNYGYEPPAWAAIDWEVARLRLRNPGVVLEVLINGANGGGKSFYAASRTCQVLANSKNWLVWCHSEDENNSERVQQRNIYHYLPLDYKTDKGSIRKTAKAKLSYNVAGGFTDNKFALHNGTVCEFRFWSKELTTLEGVRPYFAWTDEEVPLAWMEGITRRLLSWAAPTVEFIPRLRQLVAEHDANPDMVFPKEERHLLFQGVHLITFTPRSGYTPTVREFVHGAVNVQTVEAELLPADKNGKPARVPKVQRCSQPHRLVYYLHAYDNKHAGNWEGMKKMAAQKSEREIKWWCYGVTEATSGIIFVKFRRAAHVRPLDRLPKSGTWYMVADPCDGKRNWFMLWMKVTRPERFVAREWPQQNDLIPGVGYPGPWAETAKGKRQDGDPGPAQTSFGGGFRFIANEIRRVERELGELEWNLAGKPEGGPQPIVILPGCRIMDARAGNTESLAASEAKTLIQSMAEVWLEPDGRLCEGEREPGLFFTPAGRDSGAQEGANSSIKFGYKFIENAIYYDEDDAALNDKTGLFEFKGKAPQLFVADCCQNLIFSFENLTGADGLKGACKDPMDGLRYLEIAEPMDWNSYNLNSRGGGYY